MFPYLDEIFGAQGICSHLSRFGKNCFCLFLAAILNFCVKHKIHLLQKWCKIEQFGLHFWPTRYTLSHLALFGKTCVPVIIGGHLEFLHKRQAHLSWKRSEMNEIHSSKGIYRVIWHFLPKIIFSPFLADILNFCIKYKTAFFSEAVRDRAIWTKFPPTLSDIYLPFYTIVWLN